MQQIKLKRHEACFISDLFIFEYSRKVNILQFDLRFTRRYYLTLPNGFLKATNPFTSLSFIFIPDIPFSGLHTCWVDSHLYCENQVHVNEHVKLISPFPLPFCSLRYSSFCFIHSCVLAWTSLSLRMYCTGESSIDKE